MSRKKRNWLIVCVAISIGALAAYFIRDNIKEYNKKWKFIDQAYMADFTGNGQQEILLIYESYEEISAMKLVDIKSGNTIWKSSTHPSHIYENKRITVQDGILAIAYNDFINKPDSGFSQLGVEGFSSVTGEKLWDHKFEEHRRNFGLYFWLAGYKNKLFTLTDDFNTNDGYITSIEKNTGKIAWEDTIYNSYSWMPNFVENKMVVGEAIDINVIDIETGKIEKNVASRRFSRVMTTESDIYFHAKDTIFIYDSIIHPLYFDGRTVTVLGNDSSRTTIIANADGSFISINEPSYNSNSVQAINSTPYKSNRNRYSYNFGDSLKIHYLFYDEALSMNPEVSSFHSIETRYIPLIIEKEINEDTLLKQLVIFDVELGKPNWKSEAFKCDRSCLNGDDVLYNKEHFVIMLDFSDKYSYTADHSYFVLNGNTGKFCSNINLNSNDVYISNLWMGYDMFSGDYFYGSSSNVAWGLSYPYLELVYTTNKKLKSRDGKERLEKMFGKMPWEKKSSKSKVND